MTLCKSLVIILLILLIKPASAQVETVEYLQSADTCVQTTLREYSLISKYLVAEKRNQKNLFKLDLIQLAQGRPGFAWEHKLSKKLSFEISTLAGIIFENDLFFLDATRYYHASLIAAKRFNLNSDIRYYYNLESREKKNQKAINFSAGYFTFGIGSDIYSFDHNYYMPDNGGFLKPVHTMSDGTWVFAANTQDLGVHFGRYKNTLINNKIYTKIGYGLQRRIGNIGYIDAQFKMAFAASTTSSNYYIFPELNIKAGFALSSFKRNH